MGQLLPDVIFGCLAQAVPEVVPAEGCSVLWQISARGQRPAALSPDLKTLIWAIASPVNGGTGARPNKDGLDATAFPSGVRGTPVEINESVAPIVVWAKEYLPDSGGPGKFRGGLGQIVTVQNALPDFDYHIMAMMERTLFPARGR